MINPHQKASMLHQLEMAWDVVNELPTTTPCLFCIYDKQGHCMKWDASIPKDALEKGCDQFVFDTDSAPF